MVDPDRYRQATGCFATGVTVVTVRSNDMDHGMTVNSFASVSLDPPLVLFNADKQTNTHDYVPEGEKFAVNVLTEDQKWISNRFAGEHHDMESPFEDIETSTGESGAPIFEEALAYIDCTLWGSFDAGDHTIYVGKVVDLDVTNKDANPLTFFKGEYASISKR
jgi:flavin reductase (DIM6/NTAB) family NADH-FMN oxidoreductase RutF